MQEKRKTITSALGWKLLERFGMQGSQFIIQLILARLLSPDFYGVLSLMIVFTALADVFIQKGFTTALIQNKDVTDADYSSVFWLTLGVAGILYAVLYLAAPYIAEFYEMPEITEPFRALSLMILPGALNSVQGAKLSREMDFKKVFYSNIGGVIVSGIAGIAIAYMGGGLWALVAQRLINLVTVCFVMWFTVKWRPKLVISIRRVKVLFSYGWKLLVSGLIETLYKDIHSLVIGKKYDSGTLGYYSKGNQFPNFIISSVNSAIQSVMLPAMSAEQDDDNKVKELMRNSIMLSSYIIFPMMAGLAAIATPLIELLLTDKWLPCVAYLQIGCFCYAFYPVNSCNLQAINAVGRSDVFLKLEIIKKIIGMITLIIALTCFDSPMAIALTGAITTIISCFINASPNKKLIGYSYFEQMRDILPSLTASLVMCGCVLLIQLIGMETLQTFILQIVVGVMVYVVISAVFRLEPFLMILEMIKNMRYKKTQ